MRLVRKLKAYYWCINKPIPKLMQGLPHRKCEESSMWMIWYKRADLGQTLGSHLKLYPTKWKEGVPSVTECPYTTFPYNDEGYVCYTGQPNTWPIYFFTIQNLISSPDTVVVSYFR